MYSYNTIQYYRTCWSANKGRQWWSQLWSTRVVKALEVATRQRGTQLFTQLRTRRKRFNLLTSATKDDPAAQVWCGLWLLFKRSREQRRQWRPADKMLMHCSNPAKATHCNNRLSSGWSIWRNTSFRRDRAIDHRFFWIAELVPVAAPHQGAQGQINWQKYLRPGCRPGS